MSTDASIDSPRARGHDKYAVTHVDRFIDVMSDQEYRGETGLPQAQHLILHSHARESIEGPERLVKQENFGMSN